MKLQVLIVLVVLHFVSDFLLQSREMGVKKSEDPNFLLKHAGILLVVFGLGLIPFLGLFRAMVFSITNTAVHCIIDWNIWHVYKWSVKYRHPLTPIEELKKFRYWEDYWFLVTIGTDQMLHTITLFLVYFLVM